MDIAIVGASGYAGGDLIRLLLTHPQANIVCATSRKLAGTPVTKDHIHLKNLIDLDYTNPDVNDIDADFAFLAVPHTAAMQYALQLRERGIKTVDLSAVYRLPQDIYENFTATKYAVPTLLQIRAASQPAQPLPQLQ